MKWNKPEELTWDRVVVFVDDKGHIGIGEVILDDQLLLVRELVHPDGITRIVHPYKIKGWMDYNEFEWPTDVKSVKEGSWSDHTCWARDGILSTVPESVEERIQESHAKNCGKGWKNEA